LEDGEKLYKFNLDAFTLPSVVRKVLKSMKKGEVCELKTSSVKNLLTYFPNQYFDQYKLFKEGENVSMIMGLVWISKDEYFYQQKVSRKLERIQHFKNVAGQFFKGGNFLKAAKIYQKINGYYNFGDANNNYQKEDE
jgi:RecG-like helicase